MIRSPGVTETWLILGGGFSSLGVGSYESQSGFRLYCGDIESKQRREIVRVQIEFPHFPVDLTTENEEPRTEHGRNDPQIRVHSPDVGMPETLM